MGGGWRGGDERSAFEVNRQDVIDYKLHNFDPRDFYFLPTPQQPRYIRRNTISACIFQQQSLRPALKTNKE